MTLQPSDYIGFVGSAVVVVLYCLSLQGRIDTTRLAYPLLNLLGCGFIMMSLVYNFNAPSFVIEIFWAAVSLYGLFRHLRRRLARHAAAAQACQPPPSAL